MKELHLVIVSPEKLVYEGKSEPGYLSGKRRKISGHGRPCPADFYALGRGSEIRGRTGNAIPANQGGDSWKSRRIRFQSVWNSERSEAGDEPNMFLAAFRMKNRTILCFC